MLIFGVLKKLIVCMQAEHLDLWKKIKSYMRDDFQIPLEDHLYDLRLNNSMQLAIEVMKISSTYSVLLL